jgi:hypothetical protein
MEVVAEMRMKMKTRSGRGTHLLVQKKVKILSKSSHVHTGNTIHGNTATVIGDGVPAL